MTHHIVGVTVIDQKFMIGAKGEGNFQSVLERIWSKSEGVKRRLEGWKVRILGIK